MKVWESSEDTLDVLYHVTLPEHAQRIEAEGYAPMTKGTFICSRTRKPRTLSCVGRFWPGATPCLKWPGQVSPFRLKRMTLPSFRPHCNGVLNSRSLAPNSFPSG